MKKLFIGMLVSLLGLMSPSILMAAASCDNMAIVSTGTTVYTESGLFVKVKPVETNLCGEKDQVIQYYLDIDLTSETYATILTALSLEKNLFIQVSDVTENSLLLVVSIKSGR